MFCLQMYILYLEAGVLCTRRKGAGGLGSAFRISPRVTGNKIVLLPCLVGTGMHKRWMSFFTLTFATDYEVDWTEAGVSRQVGSR